MFYLNKKNKNLIESDEGFSVELCGMTGIQYRENDILLFIDSEILTGSSGLVIYKNTLVRINNNKKNHQDYSIDENTKDRIVNNIKNAFKFKGYIIEII